MDDEKIRLAQLQDEYVKTKALLKALNQHRQVSLVAFAASRLPLKAARESEERLTLPKDSTQQPRASRDDRELSEKRKPPEVVAGGAAACQRWLQS
ncbi:hypothetical protein RJT34_13007 [Clitoria ternatea]|uniref:Uncharacterized protein n=1 Tax=Clitoria ternatea TaxID=43366 RepID=A0AAN9JN53_CLITE